MKKGIFIIVYFGKIPSYFTVWKKTAERSKKFDFLIVTDDTTAIFSDTNNIKICIMTFTEFKERVQRKFQFTVNLNNPRKLCDYKPAYGYLFEEEIKEYDYWGYCDLDLIFGDIDKLIPLEQNYDKLFAHGHMTLFKNSYEMNRIFMKKINHNQTFEDIYKNDYNFVFDEPSDNLNINLICAESQVKTYIDYNIADVNPYSYLFRRSLYDYSCPNKKDRITKLEKNGKTVYLWDNGSLKSFTLDGNKILTNELRYFHFQKRNMDIQIESDVNVFLIIPNKLIPFNGKITEKEINKYTKKKLIYKQYFALKYKNLKKKLGGK